MVLPSSPTEAKIGQNRGRIRVVIIDQKYKQPKKYRCLELAILKFGKRLKI